MKIIENYLKKKIEANGAFDHSCLVWLNSLAWLGWANTQCAWSISASNTKDRCTQMAITRNWQKRQGQLVFSTLPNARLNHFEAPIGKVQIMP